MLQQPALVTGVAGFIASKVAKMLLQQGRQVIGGGTRLSTSEEAKNP